MAGAVRGGDVRGVTFHSDKGSEYTADLFAQTCKALGVTQSMGRVGVGPGQSDGFILHLLAMVG
jgi:putative transposase